MKGNDKLIPSQSKFKQGEKSTETWKEKNLSLISPKEIEKEINGTQIIILVAWEVAKESQEMIPPVATPIITKFTDVFPKDLLDQLPLMYTTCYWFGIESHSA